MTPPRKLFFVCRSEYEMPLGHRVVELDAPDLLTWFQRRWVSRDFIVTSDPAEDWTEEYYKHEPLHRLTHEIFGGDISGFEAIWAAMAKRSRGAPKDNDELRDFLMKLEYMEGELRYDPHVLQLRTNDGEIGVAWYLFDSEFARENPRRVAYLLRTDPDLPVDFSDRGARPASDPTVALGPDATTASDPSDSAATYCVFLSTGHQWFDEGPQCFRFPGVRLPELAAHLSERSVPTRSERQRHGTAKWPDETVLLRACSMRAGGDIEKALRYLDATGIRPTMYFDGFSLSDARHQWKDDACLVGERASVLRDLERIEESNAKKRDANYRERLATTFQVSEHLIRLGFQDRVRRWTVFGSSWIFFDDLWIAANPDLAQSLLHFASRWDCLIPSETEGTDDRREGK